MTKDVVLFLLDLGAQNLIYAFAKTAVYQVTSGAVSKPSGTSPIGRLKTSPAEELTGLTEDMEGWNIAGRLKRIVIGQQRW